MEALKGRCIFSSKTNTSTQGTIYINKKVNLIMLHLSTFDTKHMHYYALSYLAADGRNIEHTKIEFFIKINYVFIAHVSVVSKYT